MSQRQPFRELAERPPDAIEPKAPCSICGALTTRAELIFAPDGNVHCVRCDRPLLAPARATSAGAALAISVTAFVWLLSGVLPACFGN